MRASVCENSCVEKRNGELFIRVPGSNVRGIMCWLPRGAINPAKAMMDDSGKVKPGSAFLVVEARASDQIYECRDFITFPGGDMAVTIGRPVGESILQGQSDER